MVCSCVLSSAALCKPPVTCDTISGLPPPRSQSSQCLPHGKVQGTALWAQLSVYCLSSPHSILQTDRSWTISQMSRQRPRELWTMSGAPRGPAVWEVVVLEGLQGAGLRALGAQRRPLLVGRALASCPDGLGRMLLVHGRNSRLRPTAEGWAAWASRFLLLLSRCLLTQPAATTACPARVLRKTPRKAEAQRPVVEPEGGGLPPSSSRSQDSAAPLPCPRWAAGLKLPTEAPEPLRSLM